MGLENNRHSQLLNGVKNLSETFAEFLIFTNFTEKKCLNTEFMVQVYKR